MCRKYNKKLKFSDYITDEYHGRTGGYMTTNDCNVLFDKIKNGWSFSLIKDGFWLRCPDISVIDITDPFRVYKFGNKIVYFALFKYLKDLLNSKQINHEIDKILQHNDTKYKNLSYYISQGSVLEGEIRIGGSDQRINDLRDDILNTFLKNDEFKRYLKSAKSYLNNLKDISIMDLDFEVLDKKSINLINQLNILNETLYNKRKELNLKKLDGIIGNLPESDVLIFIPTGCYKYISSFINKETVKKIMLWEIHANKDICHSNKYLSKKIFNKKCLIIDQSYTGETLDMMAKLVKKEGGIPIKLALFPKNKLAVQRADYVLFLDKLIRSDLMELDDNWIDHYYKNILNINC